MEFSVGSNLEEEIQALSHEDRCEVTLSTLRTLIHSDNLLCDLPVDCTIEEVNSQIAVAHGQSITVQVLRNQESTLDVVVACTNWKRILMVLTGQYNTTDLSTIPASLVHESSSLQRLSEMPIDEASRCLSNYTRFIMVRHPFERLLSAYRNKLEGTMPSAKYFQARIGRYIVRKYRPRATQQSLLNGDDVTFREFVQYLITDGLSNDTVNEHWQPIYQLCHPCSMNYTFIGKYERLLEDSELLLNIINAGDIRFPVSKPSNTHNKMRKYYSQLSLREIELLYRMYKNDFKLFGYELDEIIGYDIA